MKGEERQHLTVREYVADLSARGRYHFISADAQAALGVSPAAAKLAINRLSKQKVIASPARGFYVIVPPEYQALRCLPADQFIPDLMKRHDMSYYAGLLSAAQYHGAAHHRPQEFQVCVATNRRPIKCGAVRAVFIVRKQIVTFLFSRSIRLAGRSLCQRPKPRRSILWDTRIMSADWTMQRRSSLNSPKRLIP